MATRALIGYLSDDGSTFVCTYNHYDGYPDGLGKTLNDHYNSDDKAEDVASTGYISYIDDDGTINSKYDEAPNRLKLSGDFDEEDMLEIASKVDEYGGDYGYVWYDGEWHTLKNRGIRAMAEDLEDAMESTVEEFDEDEYESDIMNDTMDESYQSKWKKFLNEDDSDETDMIFDYADRLLGAGVEDFEALADFYADNPDEVPEPMDAGFFLKYKDEIVNAANDQYRYDSSDAGME